MKVENDISVSEYIQEAKIRGFTKQEVYEIIEEYKKDLEDPNIKPLPLRYIKCFGIPKFTPEGFEELKKSWG